MTQIILVLGASGHFGSQAARAFAAAGWSVKTFQRRTDMTAAAMGVDLIVNAMSPPNYHAWDRLFPQITAQVIAAGLASGATVLVPGNVHVYGTVAGPRGPATPPRPIAVKVPFAPGWRRSIAPPLTVDCASSSCAAVISLIRLHRKASGTWSP